MPQGRTERMRKALNISAQTMANSSVVNDLINFAAPSDRILAVASDGSDFPRKSNENFKPFPFARKIRCKKQPAGGGRQILLPSLLLLRSSETAAFAECLLNTEGAGLCPFPFPSKRTEIFRPLRPGGDIIHVRRSTYRVFQDRSKVES